MRKAELTYEGGMRFVGINRGHRPVIDLPVSSGGSDSGPTPTETFMNAIGACVGAYVASYCRKTGIDTDGLKIEVIVEKERDEKPYYIEKIGIKIKLPRERIGKREKALLKIAHSCFLHETLKRRPEINIDLS